MLARSGRHHADLGAPLVLQMPVPGTFDDGIQAGALWRPPEDSAGVTGIRYEGGWVTSATRTVAHRHTIMGDRESLPFGRLHNVVDSGNDLSHRQPLAGTQIERAAFTALEDVP